jgi:PTS system nitrogen regulatory IIA component
VALITMASILAPDRVIAKLRARTGAQVVRAMARVAVQAAPSDADSIANAVLARAKPSAYAVGEGVALPHATIAGLDRPIGVFARLDPACDLEAMDGRTVDLVLLLLTPEGDDAMLLRTLACGARRLRDPDVVARVRSAHGAGAMHAVLTSDAWRGVWDDGPHAASAIAFDVSGRMPAFDKSGAARDDRAMMSSASSFRRGFGRAGNLVEGE